MSAEWLDMFATCPTCGLVAAFSPEYYATYDPPAAQEKWANLCVVCAWAEANSETDPSDFAEEVLP